MKIKNGFLEIFDGKYDRYGGHSQWIGRLIFRHHIYQLGIGLQSNFKFRHYCFFYDCHRHSLELGFIFIIWEGFPYKETDQPL